VHLLRGEERARGKGRRPGNGLIVFNLLTPGLSSVMGGKGGKNSWVEEGKLKFRKDFINVLYNTPEGTGGGEGKGVAEGPGFQMLSFSFPPI